MPKHLQGSSAEVNITLINLNNSKTSCQYTTVKSKIGLIDIHSMTFTTRYTVYNQHKNKEKSRSLDSLKGTKYFICLILV